MMNMMMIPSFCKRLTSYFVFFFICLSSADNIFYVDHNDPHAFQTIQSAIYAVPSYNTEWFEIRVREGTYREKLTVPADKPFIYLNGDGMGRTNVVWGDSSSMSTSSSVTFLADNIMVSGMAFINSHNYPPENNSNEIKPAVAVRVSGDKIAFYKCSFLGFQDTLFDHDGRHYFSHCLIEGGVDFIFGNGQSIYEQCDIRINVGILYPHLAGFITAQARDGSDDSNGFLFNKCRISGNGKVFLGRTYRNYSRVIFNKSIMSDNVVPEGWSNFWDRDVDKITFAESQCRGKGSNVSKRVKWMKRLSYEAVKKFARLSYIDDEGWLKRLPIDVLSP